MEEFVKAGITGWPAAFIVVGVAICFASLFIGWPWEGIIIINKHYHCKKCDNCEEDND